MIRLACKNACGGVGWGFAMRRRTRTVIVPMLAVLAALLGAGSVSATGSPSTPLPAHGFCGGSSLRPTTRNLSRVVGATLCLIEREREIHHLDPLRLNRSLQQIAVNQTMDMVLGDYFGDNSLAGGTPWQRITASPYAVGARSLSTAQNIGWGTAALATPQAMVEGWMLSPPHRRIVLTGAYRDIGVGVAPAAPSSLTDGLPGATYTVEFANRR
jgi:uncharacterized protein YkwD